MRDTNRLAAVDVHGHYGELIATAASDLQQRCASADAHEVLRRAEAADIACTVVSPFSGLFPVGQADAVAANDQTVQIVESLPGLLQWVIVHPLQPRTFDQARAMLDSPKCVGIKLHPESHQYPIKEQGQKLFEFAAKMGAVVLAHSGDELSWPVDYLPWANEFPEVQLILAHLGNGGKASGALDLQARAVKASKHGNVWTDTSSARSIMSGLIEWAVDEIGAERILFGTDTPLYFAPMQRARIDVADISQQDKRLILRDNAVRLLKLTDDFQSKVLG